MTGRRMSEGVHQALECKENVPIQRESQTLASTTFQNFFRLFTNLSGMTGTADTEALEFQQIYGLNVISLVPNEIRNVLVCEIVFSLSGDLTSYKFFEARIKICLLHCLFAPSLIILSYSSLALTIESEIIHKAILLLTIPVSIFAISLGYKNHSNNSIVH